MSKLKLLLTSVFVIFFVLLFPSQALADNDDIDNDCDIRVEGVSAQLSSSNPYNFWVWNPDNNYEFPVPEVYAGREDENTLYYNIRVCANDLSAAAGNPLRVATHIPGTVGWTNFNLTENEGCYSGVISFNKSAVGGGDNSTVYWLDVETSSVPVCAREQIFINKAALDNSNFNENVTALCESITIDPGNPIVSEQTTISYTVPADLGNGPFLDDLGNNVFLYYELRNTANGNRSEFVPLRGRTNYSKTYNPGDLSQSTYEIAIAKYEAVTAGGQVGFGAKIGDICQGTFSVGTPQNPGEVIGLNAILVDRNNPINPFEEEVIPYSICNQLEEGPARTACETCKTNTDGSGIWTALGCFSGQPTELIAGIVIVGLNIGGGAAILLILVAAFMFSTSQGDPKRTGDAKEMMQAAVIGLLFIIFSVTILEFIGVNILQIPGFGEA